MLVDIEHSAGGQGVGGSNPLAPTIFLNTINRLAFQPEQGGMLVRAPNTAESRIAAQKSPSKSPPDVRGSFSPLPLGARAS